MRAPVKLETGLAIYERLFELAHGKRKTVRISRSELMGLLIDHGRMIRELGPAVAPPAE